jgi:hypothetical protein
MSKAFRPDIQAARDFAGNGLMSERFALVAVGGRGLCVGADKIRSQKMLENGGESHLFRAPKMSGRVSFYTGKRGYVLRMLCWVRFC